MSEKIEFILDGETVYAEKGQSIWEVANGKGLKIPRSEERRVGKECRSRWSPYH